MDKTEADELIGGMVAYYDALLMSLAYKEACLEEVLTKLAGAKDWQLQTLYYCATDERDTVRLEAVRLKTEMTGMLAQYIDRSE